MEFGSTHVYLVRSSGPTLSDVASGFQEESAEVSTLTSTGPLGAAPLPTEMPKVGATLTYEDAILDVKNVYNLTEHVVDWFGLGTQLEITNSRLKKIGRENDTEDGRRRETIVSWLYGDPEASWEKLSKALVRVDHRVLANRIDKEILPLQQCRFIPRGPKPGSSWMKKGLPSAPFSTTRSIPMKAKVEADYPDSPSPRPSLEDKDTNVLMIKFGALSKPCKVHTGDPIICSNSQCAAILNYHSKITKETEGRGNVWICEFCSTKNTIEIEAGEIPKEGDILYLQQPQHSSKHDTLVSGITKDSIVVFCVDTSGSMGVTTEVPGKKELKGHEKVQKLKEIYAGSGIQYMPGQYRNVTYISRLQCVQAAIDHQLTALARNNPSQRVAIVMFGDEVTVTGDGRPENEFVFVGEKLWKENAMLKLIENIPTPSPIKDSRELLNKKIFSIEEEGQTALGGALLVSVELAKRAPGSKVILCTDGLANRGIGNLDDEKCTESSVAFYKKLGIAAKESSVSVSVLTIKGTDCDLLHLGEVANLSGGNVDVVDPMSLSEEFVNILSTSVVAVRVNARIILHSTLSFKDGDGKNTLSVPVGNVVDATKLMYEFSSSEKNAGRSRGDYKELHEVPFQAQIKYTSLDGQQCLRVFTEARPTTSDKGVANQGAKNDVLMAYTLNKEGNFFLRPPLRRSAGASFIHHGNLLSQGIENSIPPCPPYYRALRQPLLACEQNLSEKLSCKIEGIEDSGPTRPLPSSCRRTSSQPSLKKLSRCKHYSSASRVHQGLSQCPIGEDADEVAATAFQQVQGKMEPSQRTVKVQKHITLTNEGYGFGFLISPGKEGGTVVQSLIPNGVAWKDGELRKGDKILTINGECVEKMDYQDVVKKLRLLNDEATNSITLCIVREEVCQGTSSMMKDHAEDTKLLSVNLQSNGPNSVGLTFKFIDSEHLIIEEIKPDGIAAKDSRLKVNDTVLEINGEAVGGKTGADISAMLKDIEESNGSMELLVRRKIPVSLRVHKNTKLSHRKPPVLKSLPSWSQPSLQTPMPKLNLIVTISLHNQGYGFGFTVQETEDKSIVVSTVFPEGVAHKDGRLRANDKLIEISGRKVSDMTYKEVIAMLRALNEGDHSVIDLKVERKV